MPLPREYALDIHTLLVVSQIRIILVLLIKIYLLGDPLLLLFLRVVLVSEILQIHKFIVYQAQNPDSLSPVNLLPLLNLLLLIPILQSKFLLVFCKQTLPVREILDLDILKNTDVQIVAVRIQNVVIGVVEGDEESPLIGVGLTVEGENEKWVVLPQPISLG